MSRARNMELEERMRAVVELAELTVRDQQPDPGNPHCGWGTMAECHTLLASEIAVSREQAISNAWPARWRDAVDKAHSIRCVPINAHTKDPKRIQMFKCDVCGAKEKWCGMAIDLAGGRERPEKWYDPTKLKQQWLEHSTRYAADLVAEHDSDGLMPCDLGRFYPGATCYRRTILRYTANTMLPEVCHRAWMMCSEFDDEQMETEELQYADEGGAQELLDLKQQLELCIADERRHDLPDPMSEDTRLWDAVDEARGGHDRPATKQRAHRTLGRVEDDGGDEGDEDADGRDEDYDSDASASSGGGSRDDRAVPPKKRRRGVLYSDEEEEEEEDEEDPAPAAPVAKQPTRKRSTNAPPPRRSSRVAGLSPGEPPPLPPPPPPPRPPAPPRPVAVAAPSTAATTEREPEDLADVHRARPARAQPAAARAATAARINGNLPSGLAILTAAIRLQLKLTLEERHDDASVMDSVVMEMRNLQAKVERARGTQGTPR